MTDTPRPLRSHFSALRRLTVRSALCLGIVTTAVVLVVPWFFHLLTTPYQQMLAATAASTGQPIPGVLQSLDPSESFRLSFKIALLIGAVVTSPYALYLGWHFIRPGLHAREQRGLRLAVISGLGLFICGGFFAFFLVVPLLLHFFWDYSLVLGITPNWTVGYYIDFLLGLIGAFGCAFELPLLVVLLVHWNILSLATLQVMRRYVYFAIFVVAAIVTPPDLVSCLLMGIPLLALYELAVLVAHWIAPTAVIETPSDNQGMPHALE